jgi:hypothetical protein
LGGALEEFVDQSLIGLGLLGGEAGERSKSRSLPSFGMTTAEVAIGGTLPVLVPVVKSSHDPSAPVGMTEKSEPRIEVKIPTLA